MLRIDWQGVFVGHAYRLQAMCDLLMRTSPKHYDYGGKDRQHTREQLCRSMQVHVLKMQDARGVCALENPSSVFNGSLLKSANIYVWWCNVAG